MAQEKNRTDTVSAMRPAWALAGVTGLLLAACGGGSAVDSAGTAIFQLSSSVLPAEVGLQTVQPAFYMSPVQPTEPNTAAAGNTAPSTSVVPAELDGLSTQRMTPQALQAALAGDPSVAISAAAATSSSATTHAADGTSGTSGVQPMATGSVVATYTPAQIRAAYGFPSLPASFTGLTASQAAQLGAGQTIYIVDAQHDPNAAAELAAFNTRFALPQCTTRSIATSAALPLSAPSTNACDFSVVYSTTAGTMSATAPAYNAGWATEITLDIQWAHATAPLARIVLIEAPDSSLNGLLGAIQLANAMGPGVVSMSFGGAEGNWTASVDSHFAAPGMTYLAATGDNGAGVSWPSVSSNVVAVGGTTLTYSGTGPRSEVGWSGTGGGTSAYTATPSYQTSAVPGLGTVAHRTVADVAFNADPSTGQYVVSIAPGSSTQSWLSVGGTSLATPQWAGLFAIANAERIVAGKALLGAPHGILYSQIATSASTYSSVFADVTNGSDGSCATCTARQGYDPLSGLGTPNSTSLLAALSGTSTTGTPAPATAPVVTAATVNAQVGTALSYNATATAAHTVTYALTGAPSGMVISSTGVVTWPAPVLGTYSVTVTATDTTNHLSGSAVLSVKVAAATVTASGLTITSSTFTGKAGVALSGTIALSDSAASAITVQISGVPAGVVFSANGLTLTATWAKPVKGNYTMLVQAHDSAGRSAQLTVPITIN